MEYKDEKAVRCCGKLRAALFDDITGAKVWRCRRCGRTCPRVGRVFHGRKGQPSFLMDAQYGKSRRGDPNGTPA